MYNDNNENYSSENSNNGFSRPNFDSKTGEPINYDENENHNDNQLNNSAESDAQTASTEQQDSSSFESTTYRYSQQDIPFGGNQGYGSNQGYGNEYGNAYGSNQDYGTNYGAAQSAGKTPKAKKTKVKKEKKPAGFVKKAARFVAAAVLFGAIAGGTMYGAYYAGYKILPTPKGNYDIETVSSTVLQSQNNSNNKGDVSLTNTMNVEAVAQAAMPAMVALTGKTTVSGGTNNYYYGYGGNQAYEATTSGTGIIVGKSDTELLILTNAHVVDNVNNLNCIFVDGEPVSCTVKGSKSDQDIAVVAVNLSDIKSSTIESIAIAELANSDDVALGQQVVAIGNALGEGQSVTNGIISALDRSITVDNVTFSGLIMTNAAINSGNSGGALLNAEGKVIAINFAKTSEEGVEGMAYSIPVSNVSDLIGSLMTKQARNKVSTSEASYLGISGIDITASTASQYGYPQGVLVQKVGAGSPAESAGLLSYDIIVSFDDQTVSSMTGLTSIMQYYKAGETVSIDYYHLDGSEYVLKTIDVTLGSKN